MDDQQKEDSYLSYLRNAPVHKRYEEPEFKVYDTFLDLVYFAGLARDEEMAEKRVGWRDPTLFVACFEDESKVTFR